MPKKVVKKDPSLSDDESDNDRVKKNKLELKGKRTKDMKRCFCCNINLTRGNTSGVCSSCKSDKTKTITSTEAKKIYGVTDIDLCYGMLNYFHVGCPGGGIGNKYFVSEIEEYVNDMIESGDSSLLKKKQKNDDKKLKEKKKNEIENFINKNIKNSNDSNIEKLKDEYISSKALELEDVCKTIIIRDKEITYKNERRKEYFNNLTDLVLDELNSEKYINKMKFKNKNFNSFLNSDWYKNFLKEISSYLNTEYTDTFILTIFSKKVILKTGIIDKIISDISELFFAKIDVILRTNELTKKLKNVGLNLRSDSKVCNYYIKGGVDLVNENMDNNIENIDDIVEIMKEMDFYHTKTHYPELNKKQLHKYSHYVYNNGDSDDDNEYDYYYGHYEYTKPVSEINLIAKKMALKKVNENIIKNAPKNVKKLYESLVKNDEKPKMVIKKVIENNIKEDTSLSDELVEVKPKKISKK